MVRHLAVLPVLRYSQLNIVLGFTRTKFIGHHSSYRPLWEHSSPPEHYRAKRDFDFQVVGVWFEDPHGLSRVQYFFSFFHTPSNMHAFFRAPSQKQHHNRRCCRHQKRTAIACFVAGVLCFFFCRPSGGFYFIFYCY